MFWRSLLLICALALLISAALADEAVLQQVCLEPSGRVLLSPLDDEQPDTIYYDDGSPTSYYGTTNYYVYTRFTPPADFQLRSLYVVVYNPSGHTATCSLFVHLPNGNVPGDLLSTMTFVPEAGFYVYDVNLDTPIDFTAAQDFMVVVGRAPGGGQEPPLGWHMTFDNATTTNRSRRATSHYGAYQITPDD